LPALFGVSTEYGAGIFGPWLGTITINWKSLKIGIAAARLTGANICKKGVISWDFP
jgi:hypothetical protein